MRKQENGHTEVIFKLNNSDVSDGSDLKRTPIKNLAKVRPTIILKQIKANDTEIFDKLCMPYIARKLTLIVKSNKGMIVITNKFKEVHVDL